CAAAARSKLQEILFIPLTLSQGGLASRLNDSDCENWQSFEWFSPEFAMAASRACTFCSCGRRYSIGPKIGIDFWKARCVDSRSLSALCASEWTHAASALSTRAASKSELTAGFDVASIRTTALWGNP